MPSIEKGVKSFVYGEATIRVSFPVGLDGKVCIACKYCPFLSSNERICQLNKQPVAFPQKYIGWDCPLEFEEGE